VPNRFKFGQYDSHSAEVQNSAKNFWVVLEVLSVLKSLEDIFSVRIHTLDPGNYMLSQNLLVNVIVKSFAGRNWLSVA
jgi:hypothetical protein